MPSDRNSVTVLALDPGERVGWSLSRFYRDAPLAFWRWDVLDYGILPLKKAALDLHQPRWQFNVLLYESWILTAKGAQVSVGSDMQSSQFVGMIRLAHWLNPTGFKLVEQPPRDMSTGRLVLNDDRPDYSAVRDITNAAPASHDDSHYTSALLHTAKFFHKEYA
jgi:hypothetical protein